MRELEKQTYDFAVAGISLIKSLEKDFPELVSSDLKRNIGNVSTKYIDAVNSAENEDFAKYLRECHNSAKKTVEILNTIDKIKNETFENQRIQLLNDSKVIIEKLDAIVGKLIY